MSQQRITRTTRTQAYKQSLRMDGDKPVIPVEFNKGENILTVFQRALALAGLPEEKDEVKLRQRASAFKKSLESDLITAQMQKTILRVKRDNSDKEEEITALAYFSDKGYELGQMRERLEQFNDGSIVKRARAITMPPDAPAKERKEREEKVPDDLLNLFE